MQSQAPQLVNISQLHNHQQPNVVSTGLRLSFGEQQQQQQQLQQTHHHQQHQQQQQQNIMCQSPSFLSFLSEDLATQIKRQRDELDQFLQAQVLIYVFFKLVSLYLDSFFFVILIFFFCDIDFFFWVKFIGRATASCISGEKAEALSYPAGCSGGINSPAIERKGSRSRESHAKKCGVGGTRRATQRGGAGLAGKSQGTGGNSCISTSAAAAGYNERCRRGTR